MRRRSLVLAVGCAGLLTGSAVQAQTTFYGYDDFNFPATAVVSRSYVFPIASAARSLFLAALTADVGTEDFSSFAHNTPAPLSLMFPGAGAATLTGTGPRARNWTQAGDWRAGDRYPTSGDMFLDVILATQFTVTFANPVAAFGFYGVDAGDGGGQIILDFISASGTTTITVPHPVNESSINTGNVLYFGLIDEANPFTSVVFRLPGSDNFAFDDMTIASVAQIVQPPVVTPEPVTMTLVGTGLALTAAARRRRHVRAL